MYTILGFLFFGALGALAKDVVQDNGIQLPFLNSGVLNLGFLGGMMVGAFVGYVVDHSFLTAALSGYVGVSTIEGLLSPVPKKE